MINWKNTISIKCNSIKWSFPVLSVLHLIIFPLFCLGVFFVLMIYFLSVLVTSEIILHRKSVKNHTIPRQFIYFWLNKLYKSKYSNKVKKNILGQYLVLQKCTVCLKCCLSPKFWIPSIKNSEWNPETSKPDLRIIQPMLILKLELEVKGPTE